MVEHNADMPLLSLLSGVKSAPFRFVDRVQNPALAIYPCRSPLIENVALL
jgi:hypothetical protein